MTFSKVWSKIRSFLTMAKLSIKIVNSFYLIDSVFFKKGDFAFVDKNHNRIVACQDKYVDEQNTDSHDHFVFV